MESALRHTREGPPLERGGSTDGAPRDHWALPSSNGPHPDVDDAYLDFRSLSSFGSLNERSGMVLIVWFVWPAPAHARSDRESGLSWTAMYRIASSVRSLVSHLTLPVQIPFSRHHLGARPLADGFGQEPVDSCLARSIAPTSTSRILLREWAGPKHREDVASSPAISMMRSLHQRQSHIAEPCFVVHLGSRLAPRFQVGQPARARDCYLTSVFGRTIGLTARPATTGV